MIVASKLPHGLDIGGFVLRGAMLGQEEHQRARAPGRERIAGYEITRGVPADIWERWFAQNAKGPIVANRLVAGFTDDDEQGLAAWCWANQHVRGWQQASQDGSTASFARGMR